MNLSSDDLHNEAAGFITQSTTKQFEKPSAERPHGGSVLLRRGGDGAGRLEGQSAVQQLDFITYLLHLDPPHGSTDVDDKHDVFRKR